MLYIILKSTANIWFPVKIIHWFASFKNDKQLRKFIQTDYDGLVNKPDKRIKQFQKYLPEPDRKLMTTNPEYGYEFIKGSIESYIQGIDGVVQEWKLYVSDWGMDLNAIQFPLSLWYGSDDKMAPTHRGIYFQKNLPRATIKLIENEGHIKKRRENDASCRWTFCIH